MIKKMSHKKVTTEFKNYYIRSGLITDEEG